MIVKHIHLDQPGLQKFLGSLELAIMTAAWKGCKTMASMQRYITKHGTPVSYSTVVTVVDRLRSKYLLTRVIVDNQIQYIPTISTSEGYLHIAICETLTAFHTAFPAALAQALDGIAFNSEIEGEL